MNEFRVTQTTAAISPEAELLGNRYPYGDSAISERAIHPMKKLTRVPNRPLTPSEHDIGRTALRTLTTICVIALLH